MKFGLFKRINMHHNMLYFWKFFFNMIMDTFGNGMCFF